MNPSSERVLIAEISERDFDPDFRHLDITYNLRRAARAILKHQGKIALMHVSKLGYYKLPGGIEEGEKIKVALTREILEETGCECQINQEIGVIIEYRDQLNVLQISYIFLADVIGEPGQNKLMGDEVEEGFKLVWAPEDKLLELIGTGTPQDYTDKFVTLRDRKIIDYFLSSPAEKRT